MKLILTQVEIEAAIRGYITNMVTVKDGTTMDIEFTATRGENGLTASVDINYLGVTSVNLNPEATPDSLPLPQKAKAAAPAPEEVAKDPGTEAVAEDGGSSLF